jgi:acetyltransferase
LVPVGVRSPDLDEDTDAGLLAAAAAHALERRTGPVFPAPRVISLVLAGLRADLAPVSERNPSESELAVWMQAQRALPVAGGALGMEFPSPGVNLAAPTSAFLAQRALVRAGDLQDAADLGHEGPTPPDVDGPERAKEIMRNAGETLTDQESKVVLRGYGFEVTRQAVASSASGAAGFAERIGYPVVLKALSPDLRRRTEVGGVLLDLGTAAAVRRGYAEIVDNIERLAPTAHLDGILVSEMLPDGADLRCGGRRLESGEVVLYGVIEGASLPLEPALALAPLGIPDALALAYAVISRAPVRAMRRDTDPDLRGLADVFTRLGTLFAEMGPRLDSVDLGPVRYNPERGYVVLDARIVQQPHLQGD